MIEHTIQQIPLEDLHTLATDTTVHVDGWNFGYDEDGEPSGRFWESIRCQGSATRGQFPEGASIVADEIDLASGDTVPLTDTIKRLYEHLDAVHADADGADTADTVEELVDAHEKVHEAAGTPVEDVLADLIGEQYDCGTPTNGNGVCLNPECDLFEGDEAGPYEGREGPMMNYWYGFDPLSSFDPVEAAIELVDLPLCIVEVEGGYGLALTGGGMDLTWEIVEAFTRLGMLPPTDHIDLPLMAGKRLDERNAYLLAACRRAVQVKKERLNWDLNKLDRVEQSLREQGQPDA